MNIMFSVVPFLIFLMFFTILSIILIRLVNILLQKQRDEHSPVLTLPAKIISKRANIRRPHFSYANETADALHPCTTRYFVTFEFENGDCVELSLLGGEYGLLVEGDGGFLTFQGSRYLGFRRTVIDF